ncbi:MAG: hypothetical protein PHS14_16540 [Elusimicrobia bacterium]|nr:hypothetical protein [Elusimicrobiota bacterium]
MSNAIAFLALGALAGFWLRDLCQRLHDAKVELAERRAALARIHAALALHALGVRAYVAKSERLIGVPERN